MNENTQFFLKTFYCIQIFIRFIESTELILFLAPLNINGLCVSKKITQS